MRFVDEVQPIQDPSDKDEPNVRYVHTKHGFSVKLERRDPYGFIYVVWHSGSVPIALQGAYSTYDLARQDVNRYLNLSTFNKVIDEPIVYDKAKYKKRFRKDELADG